MKKTVRLLALVLAFMMLCSGLGACGNPDPGTPATEPVEKTPKLRMFFINQMDWIREQWTTATAHGDCTYIEFPNGESMLIDTSTAYSAKFIADRLEEMGVTKINYLVVTHLHQDHVDGATVFAKRFDIDKVIWPQYGEGFTNARSTLRLAIDMYRMEEIVVRAGDQYQIGDVTLDFLWPTKDAPSEGLTSDEQKSMLNPQSMVFKMTYGDFSALFTGDITVATEWELVSMYGNQLQSTMLKIPHHGHDTSTSDSFVGAVNPKFAVCMGMGMQYANSKDNVQIRFSKRCIPVYGTFSDGDIWVETDGVTYKTTCIKGTAEFPLKEAAE